jgi:hypothetical protein
MPPTNEEQAIPVTASGLPKEKRIKTASQALAVYKRMKDSAQTSAISRSNIQGLYDGNPPYRKSELRRLGVSWMANVDWGEFRSTINRNVSSIWNMLAGTQSLIQCSTYQNDPQDPGADYSNIIAREFTKVVRDEWLNFHVNVKSRLLEMLKFGVGFCFWRDKIEWQSHFVRTGNVLFDPSTKASIDSLNFVAIRDEMSLFDLMSYVQDDEKAKESGWNASYTRKKLVDLFVKGMGQDSQEKYGIVNWESLAQAVKNEDFEIENTEFQPLRIVHMLSESVSALDEDGNLKDKGDVSHQIFVEGDENGDKSKFIFEEEKAFEGMDSAVHLMMFTTGDGWLKSARGLGKELFSFAHVSNRLINSILTGVDISSGLLMQMSSGHGAERFNVVKKGNFTIIPSDVNILQQNFMPNIKSAAEVRELIQALQNNNTGLYQTRTENPNAGIRTAEEVRTESANEARFESDQSEWYYVQWELWLRETFKRIMNKSYPKDAVGYSLHKMLFDNLKKANVPKLFMDADIWDVTSVRSIGLGSRSNGERITNEMISMKSNATLDEASRKNIDREWFGARVHWSNVDKFVSESNRDEITVLSHNMAEGENIDMMQGFPRSVGVDDADKLHLDVHFRSLIQIITRFSEGQSPDLMADAIATQHYSMHIAEHIQGMAIDQTRKAEVEKYIQVLQEIQPQIQKLQQEAQQLAQERQAQEKSDEEKVEGAERAEVDKKVQIEMYKADRMAEVEIHKANQLDVSRQQKTVTSMQAQLTDLRAKLEALAMTTQAEITRKDIETDAKIARIERENED